MAVSAPEWQHNLRTALQAQVDANAGELGQVIRQCMQILYLGADTDR